MAGEVMQPKDTLYVHINLAKVPKPGFLSFKAAGLIYQENAKNTICTSNKLCFNSHMSKEENIVQIEAKSGGFVTGGVC